MSAHNEAALRQYAGALIGCAQDWTDLDLPDIYYTAAARRERHAVEHWIGCTTVAELVAGLQALAAGGSRRTSSADVACPGGAVVSLPPYPWQRSPLSTPAAPSRDAAAQVRDLLADVLRRPADQLDGGSRLLELGLDSLAAFELEARLEKSRHASVETPWPLGLLTVDDLIRRVEEASAAATLT
jgi:acyl transferase domain-containing protein